ncbi:unnamed protein product [Brugia pahangi]|uniref:Histidine kinase n=1 Tax=Brugia pahangi TaxID=6280 RepID=A0A0N4T9F6_BRUPA|nr:unnamed protein product [Brugia pahangi]
MLDRTDGLHWRAVMTRFVRDIREIMEKWGVERVAAMQDLPAAANNRYYLLADMMDGQLGVLQIASAVIKALIIAI